MSEAALRVLHRTEFTISGAAWQKPEQMNVLPIARMTVNALCVRHNSMLSPLDTEGAGFCEQILRLVHRPPEAAATGPMPLVLPTINGLFVERWILKILCGAFAGGVVKLGTPQPWRPPEQWVRALFGEERLQKGLGFYVGLGEWRPLDGFGMTPLWRGEKEECTGGAFILLGITFMLNMHEDAEPAVREMTTGITVGAVRRPRFIAVETDAAKFRLPFDWRGELHTYQGPRFKGAPVAGPPTGPNAALSDRPPSKRRPTEV